MSYFYVYDKFVQDKKFERELVRVEERLTDIGIQGRIGRLALFRNAVELVKDEVKRGAKTVVIVGDDSTFHELMSILPELPVTIGMIPLGDRTRIADVLGIPPGAEAADVLSARIVETLDVGKVNGQYFLSSVEVRGQAAEVDCDGRFRVSSMSDGGIEVRNLGSLYGRLEKDNLANPRDGMLDVVVYAEIGKKGMFSRPKISQSVFPMQRLRIQGQGELTYTVECVEHTAQKIDIEIVPKALKIITGKGRLI